MVIKLHSYSVYIKIISYYYIYLNSILIEWHQPEIEIPPEIIV